MWGRLLGYVSELEMCPDGASTLKQRLSNKVSGHDIFLKQIEVKLLHCAG